MDRRLPGLLCSARRQSGHGALDADTLGGAVTVLACGNDTPSEALQLHMHHNDETFVVIARQLRFLEWSDVIDTAAGEAVLGPAGVPHRFENLGPGRL